MPIFGVVGVSICHIWHCGRVLFHRWTSFCISGEFGVSFCFLKGFGGLGGFFVRVWGIFREVFGEFLRNIEGNLQKFWKFGGGFLRNFWEYFGGNLGLF